MLCRAPTSATTCVGTQTGAQLSYDTEGRMTAWQNQPGSTPTSSTSNLYDGEGQRIEQQVTSGGATTSIVYVGSVEEVSTTASTKTTTTYYYAGGMRLALAVNGVFSYLGSDGLGSAELRHRPQHAWHRDAMHDDVTAEQPDQPARWRVSLRTRLALTSDRRSQADGATLLSPVVM